MPRLLTSARRCECRESELAKVKLNPDDVQFFMQQLIVSKSQAEQKLRECSGDLKAALTAYIES